MFVTTEFACTDEVDIMIAAAKPEGLFTHDIKVSDSFHQKWQEIVDVVASLADIPAALIMRASEDRIEVFVTSASEGNPYKRGDSEHLWGSGLYCERVIKTQAPLLIPDATADPEWAQNPDVKLNMISYLGFPISFPDGAYFGTLCILDNMTNAYRPEIHTLLDKFRNVVQDDLALLQLSKEFGENALSIGDLFAKMRTLKGVHPICSHCHKIRNSDGQWEDIADYISARSEAVFSHGICADCMHEHYKGARAPADK